MAEVFISVGSNIPDAFRKIDEARKSLCRVLLDFSCSSSFHTAPVSGVGHEYGNAVFRGFTSFSINELEMILKRMEREAGRDEAARKAGRVPLDLDVVIFGGEIVRPKDFGRDYFQRGYRELVS